MILWTQVPRNMDRWFKYNLIFNFPKEMANSLAESFQYISSDLWIVMKIISLQFRKIKLYRRKKLILQIKTKHHLIRTLHIEWDIKSSLIGKFRTLYQLYNKLSVSGRLDLTGKELQLKICLCHQNSRIVYHLSRKKSCRWNVQIYLAGVSGYCSVTSVTKSIILGIAITTNGRTERITNSFLIL